MLFLVSPECSLEDMQAIVKLANHYGAILSGYSDGYIDETFGDTFLKKADKSPNRYGMKLYEIDDTKFWYEKSMEEIDLVVSFNHKDAAELIPPRYKWIDFSAYTSRSDLRVLTTSYAQKSNHYVNFSGEIQPTCASIAKNGAKDVAQIIAEILQVTIIFSPEGIKDGL